MSPTLIAIAGAIFGFLGGLLLAIAAKDELWALRIYCLGAQGNILSIVESLQNRQPIHITTGIEKHLEDGATKTRILTSVGIPFLALSLFLSVVALVLALQSP